MRCSLAHATAACVSGSCSIASCEIGFADCDGDASNGCEADLSSDTTCGSCAVHCGAVDGGSTSCSGGSCALTCAADWADCDGDPANGCEQSLEAPNHCGACGTSCDPGQECRSATCIGADQPLLSAGYQHTCVIRDGGAVWCWGYDWYGALGDGASHDYRYAAGRRTDSAARSGIGCRRAGGGGTERRNVCDRPRPAGGLLGAIVAWGRHAVRTLHDPSFRAWRR